MWLSLVFHSLAARCKVRLCAPAGERELCVHEPSLSMTQLCQLSPKHSVQRRLFASVLHDASSGSCRSKKKASALRKNRSNWTGQSRSNAFSLRELSISRCAVAA